LLLRAHVTSAPAARAAVFVAGGFAGCITGATLDVNGGVYATRPPVGANLFAIPNNGERSAGPDRK